MAILLEPLTILKMTLSNRLVMPPMATAKADQKGYVTSAVLDYYADKTRGGHIGLVIVEHSYVQAAGKSSKIQLSSADDGCIEGLRRLADIIHHNGSKGAMQLNHAGCSTTAEVIGREPAGPSALPHPRTGKVCLELTRDEISNIVQDFAAAARRTKAAGFDAVEIHSAHGYLLNQFYSPLSNQRSDEYGGSIDNRTLLHRQIIDAVRSQVGEDFPIILRLGAVDYMAGGSTPADALTAARIFQEAGVNILDISGGFAGFDVPGLNCQGFFSDVSEAVRQAVVIPVILTGGITDADAAEQLLHDGKADLIGVGRALLKDAAWAKNALEHLKSYKST